MQTMPILEEKRPARYLNPARIIYSLLIIVLTGRGAKIPRLKNIETVRRCASVNSFREARFPSPNRARRLKQANKSPFNRLIKSGTFGKIHIGARALVASFAECTRLNRFRRRFFGISSGSAPLRFPSRRIV